MNPRLPQSDDRLTIAGQSGTGKTVAALWHISMLDFDARPCIVIDFKGDKHINAIKKAQHMTFDDEYPTRPGIYIYRVRPDQHTELTELFWWIYDHENVILFVDEGFMVGQYNQAYDALHIQGRSKFVTMITLTQRPVKVSNYAFSEASLIQVFDIPKRKDRVTINDDAPKIPLDYKLKRFHSYYYDVAAKTLHQFGPVPKASVLVTRIDAKLPDKKRRTL